MMLDLPREHSRSYFSSSSEHIKTLGCPRRTGVTQLKVGSPLGKVQNFFTGTGGPEYLQSKLFRS